MKSILLAALCALVALPAIGQEVITQDTTQPPPDGMRRVAVAWNANPETDIAGYRLYWGSGDTFEFVKDSPGHPPEPTEKFDVPDDFNGIVGVTAYNTGGLESLMSDTIRIVPKGSPGPSRPTNPRIPIDPTTWIGVPAGTVITIVQDAPAPDSP